MLPSGARTPTGGDLEWQLAPGGASLSAAVGCRRGLARVSNKRPSPAALLTAGFPDTAQRIIDRLVLFCSLIVGIRICEGFEADFLQPDSCVAQSKPCPALSRNTKAVKEPTCPWGPGRILGPSGPIC